VDETDFKSVCVCNATYCDNLVFEWPTESGSAVVAESSKDGLRFWQSILSHRNGHANYDASLTLQVDLAAERQTILGFGGAFTDATGINIKSLPGQVRKRLMKSYFGKHGAQYSLGRVVIAGADFSPRAYSYDDRPAGESDFQLKHWSLQPEDHNYKIPFIKEAMKLVSHHNGTLNLYGSSWSPPAFMKTSQSLVRGYLIDKDEVYRSYAQYLVNFYNAYKKEGISFWGGTVQNEPETSNGINYNFNSLQLDADQAAKFIGKYLGPTLAANGYTKDKFKLMVNDDNLDTLRDQAPTILADKDVQKYVAGLAFHWYNNGRVPYNVLDECYEKLKDRIEFVLMTEACVIPSFGQKAVDLGSWERGERYANDIIEDLKRHSAGWVDWNMALDEQGAPNWVHGYVDSPVIVNKEKGEFYKQPMYYVMTHFSRFFRPGSVVLDLSSNSTDATADSVLGVAVHKKDTGHVVVNILNKSKDSKVAAINVQGKSYSVLLRGKSISTVVIKL
jgi:glucosylceramidase